MSRVVSQEEIEKVVLELQERDGVCEPQAFVDAARPDDSPIHDLFDWDEHANSERWLLHRARQIIGRVKIVLNETRTPAYVDVTIIRDDGQRRGYVPVEVAMSDDELRDQVFAAAASGLDGWRRRLAAFTAFDKASRAIGFIGQAIDTLKPDDGEELDGEEE